ncbi:unnamed protein product [Gongylonema pulchrum]|uniref:WD_REPEATS_REGION domain-containing protein n=1 Tax=Gongylonema pulchrum TaxID=637853 RepID=A0A183E543_9BILA|nr:unnamed protein product [Gongylonema pulchrum]
MQVIAKALAWHPVHESLFVSGGGDGSLAYWLVNSGKELAFLEHAHDQAIWSLEWHPLGHILASGSNDNNTKFWARNRPGDTQDDIFGLASLPGPVAVPAKETKTEKSADETTFVPVIPGMGLNDDVFLGIQRKDARTTVGGPPVGGPLLFPEDPNTRQQQPPPKKAQRQFERMWNVAKPSASGNDDFDDEISDAAAFRRSKISLLGPTQRSLLATKQQDEERRPSASPSGQERSSRRLQNNVDKTNGLEKETAASPGAASTQMPSSLPSSAAAAASVVVQQWPSVTGAPQPPIMQQINAQPNVLMPPMTAPLAAIAQLGAAAGIPFPPLPMPPVVGPLIWPPPLPANIAPAPATSTQNQDIDYRTGAPPLPVPPMLPGTPSTSSSASGDVDLRNQQPSSSSSQTQSWRPANPSPASQPTITDELPRDAATGEVPIHDPRMRRGGSRPNLSRNSNDERPSGGVTLGTQVRDPRRRPQLGGAQTALKQQGVDYDGRFEGSQAPQRAWMPNINEVIDGRMSSVARLSPKRRDFGGPSGDFDDRLPPPQQYLLLQQQQQLAGGGPMRRAAGDSRGRARRTAY